jgi:hypothetical protein
MADSLVAGHRSHAQAGQLPMIARSAMPSIQAWTRLSTTGSSACLTASPRVWPEGLSGRRGGRWPLRAVSRPRFPAARAPFGRPGRGCPHTARTHPRSTSATSRCRRREEAARSLGSSPEGPPRGSLGRWAGGRSKRGS